MRSITAIFSLFFIVICSTSYGQESLDELVEKTDVSTLPYKIDKIIVRAFDGNNPPPRLREPERPLFYGYGLTAYYKTSDTLMFFRIQGGEIVHLNSENEVIHKFAVKGSRYSESFKSYFLSEIKHEEKKDLYIRNIYLKDKKGNYIKLDASMPWCPHCQ